MIIIQQEGKVWLFLYVFLCSTLNVLEKFCILDVDFGPKCCSTSSYTLSALDKNTFLLNFSLRKQQIGSYYTRDAGKVNNPEETVNSLSAKQTTLISSRKKKKKETY